MEIAIWKELLLQGGVVAASVWALTEFLPFGAKGAAKRGMAVLYSTVLTFTAYLVGAIRLPEVVAPEFSEATWPKFVILAVVALMTAGEAMLAHQGVAAIINRKGSA